MTALEAIRKIIEERSRERIFPFSAPLYLALNLSGLTIEEFRKEIRQLRKDGVVKMYPTINGYNFLLNEKTDNRD